MSPFMRASTGILLLSLITFGFSASFAQIVSANSSLERNYREAEIQYQSFDDERAAQILEDLIKHSEYRNSSTDFKLKTAILLAKCYDRLNRIEEFKEAAERVLAIESNFDFTRVLSNKKLINIADSLKTFLQKPLPISRASFQLNKVKTTKIRVGETKDVTISVSPKGYPVSFKLESPTQGFVLTPLDSSSAKLSFTAESLEAGTSYSARVVATSLGTSKSVEAVFEIKRGKSKKWFYAAGGGVLAVACAVILWPHKIDTLPDPPGPPR